MPKYKCKSSIKHDGKFYNIGEEIELSQKAAKSLAHNLEIISKKPEKEEPKQ